jgi:putative transposase
VADKYAQVKECIRAIYKANDSVIGYRRVTLALKNIGHVLNHKTVKRLMDELGIQSVVKIKRYVSYKGEVGRTAPNVLRRRFTARRANSKWVTDVTEFKVAGGKLYLSPVMDLHNGEVIAFQTARRPEFSMVTTMLKKAFAKLPKGAKLILHSDQGWHYQMDAYRKALKDNNIVQSMSRKGNCHDNSPMESFFGLLKSEYFHRKTFVSFEELDAGLAWYINFYNHHRIKEKLGGMSPVEYRTHSSV